MYLLDTNIISELRRIRPHGGVLSWFRTVADKDLYLSAVTLAEIQIGIEVTRRQDVEKAQAIESWLDQIEDTFNILPMNSDCFRLWAKLIDGQSNTVFEDAMIAATALIHRCTVVTRNVRDFERFPVPLLNPFDLKRGR